MFLKIIWGNFTNIFLALILFLKKIGKKKKKTIIHKCFQIYEKISKKINIFGNTIYPLPLVNFILWFLSNKKQFSFFVFLSKICFPIAVFFFFFALYM